MAIRSGAGFVQRARYAMIDPGGAEARGMATIRDLIRWSASRMNEAGVYFGHGTDNALDEARALVLHQLYLSPMLGNEYFDARVADEERQSVFTMLRRRIDERLPLAYLTNEAWFAGQPYYVDERVLVPRSPIAELIGKHFSPWLADPDSVRHILDLCAGSGCLGIACAHAFPGAQVDLSEISPQALEVAEINIAEHGVGDRVAALESDLFEAMEGRRYELIVSNPPYVDEEEMAMLPEEYRCEPELGLVAGDEGLDLVARILEQAAAHLVGTGLLIVEVGATRPQVEQAWPNLPFTWLSFEQGGEGVFLLTREQLCQS